MRASNLALELIALQQSKWQNNTSSRPRPNPYKHSSFNYSPIVPLFESTQSELLETHLMTLRLCGELLKDAAGNQDNMV
jgi:hypothetical protein